jgi:hypothetical protein
VEAVVEVENTATIRVRKFAMLKPKELIPTLSGEATMARVVAVVG